MENIQNCSACGKACTNKFCHECMIIKSKRHLTDEELIMFKNLKDARIESISELNNKLFQKTTRITYKCINCGKDYTGTFKNIKNKTELLCHQCTIESNNLNKYGVKNVFQLDSTKNKIKSTTNEKYGKDYFLQTVEARNARRKYDIDYFHRITQERLKDYCSEIKFSNNEKRRIPDDTGTLHYQEISCKCIKCNTAYVTNARRLQRCPKCYPEDWMNGTSNLEKSIFEYIKNKTTYNVVQNARGIISNKELDIYIPELKIAFEIDGDYWHGCKSTDMNIFNNIKNHSGDKQKLCYKQGIRLITIKECDFLNRKDVFFRFIDDAIMPRTRIYARNCEIKNVDTQTAKDFCNYYHVNGYRGGNEKLGLYYNGDLICLAIFGKHPKYENECIRLCYKTGYTIIGGWEKIIKHFNKPFLHYVNLMYFQGIDKTGIGFRFKKDDLVLSRNTLQKKTQLYKYCKSIDPLMSDIQNCINNGFIAIFDCGNDVRIYNEHMLKSPARK